MEITLDFENKIATITETTKLLQTANETMKARASMFDGWTIKYETQKDNICSEALDFVIQYLYSEHLICSPEDEAAPYTKEELREMAKKILLMRK